MSAEHWVEWYWQGKPDVLGENPVAVHFVRHKSYMYCSGIELGPSRGETSDQVEDYNQSVYCIRIQFISDSEHSAFSLERLAFEAYWSRDAPTV